MIPKKYSHGIYQNLGSEGSLDLSKDVLYTLPPQEAASQCDIKLQKKSVACLGCLTAQDCIKSLYTSKQHHGSTSQIFVFYRKVTPTFKVLHHLCKLSNG